VCPRNRITKLKPLFESDSEHEGWRIDLLTKGTIISYDYKFSVFHVPYCNFAFSVTWFVVCLSSFFAEVLHETKVDQGILHIYRPLNYYHLYDWINFIALSDIYWLIISFVPDSNGWSNISKNMTTVSIFTYRSNCMHWL
jgi:hypothetical protein